MKHGGVANIPRRLDCVNDQRGEDLFSAGGTKKEGREGELVGSRGKNRGLSCVVPS